MWTGVTEIVREIGNMGKAAAERTSITGEGTMMNMIDAERKDHTTAEEGIEIETGRTRNEEEEEGGIAGIERDHLR